MARRTWLSSLVMPALLGFLLLIAQSFAVGQVVPASSQHLYVVGERMNPGARSSTSGWISIVDPATGRTVANFPAGVNADVAVTRDGSRLYVASVDPSTEQDRLIAFDSHRQTKLWSTIIRDRVKYIDAGPSTLALSPDGRRLYVSSYSTTSPAKGLSRVADWLQVVDAATGRILSETIPLPDCGTSQLAVAQPSALLVVTCFGSGEVRFVDLVTHRVDATLGVLHPGDLAGGPEGLVGAALSSDGAWLDVVTNTAPFSQIFHIAVIDVGRRSLTRWLDLTAPSARKLPEGFIAFSADLDRLAVGENIQAVPGTDTATEILVFDVGAARETWHIHAAPPLAYQLVFAPDGRTLDALGRDAGASGREPANAVYAIDPSGLTRRLFFRRRDDGITRIFLGPSTTGRSGTSRRTTLYAWLMNEPDEVVR